MTFDPFFHFFGHFTTLRARISGKHYPKVKIFAKFEFSVSDLPRKSKIAPKKLFWPILIFLLSFFDSLTLLTFLFRNSSQHHRTGSNGVSMDRAHVGAHFGDRTANRFPCSEIPGQLKVQICHFLSVFRPCPPNYQNTFSHILAKFHLSSFTLTLSKTAVTELVRLPRANPLPRFFFGRFFDGIELGSR